MLTELIITDITRMTHDFICIGAVKESGESIRPLIPDQRIHQDWCCQGETYIQPFTKVLVDLLSNRPLPPHTEDWFFDPRSLEVIGILTEEEKHKLLKKIKDKYISSIFGAELEQADGQIAYFIRQGTGQRSLGTITVNKLINFSYRFINNNWDYRLTFTDDSNKRFSIKIVDLKFQTYVNHQRICRGLTCEQIRNTLMDKIKKCEDVYLRIGLARGWAQFPERCYLQITGVFPFPNFFPSHSFHDLLSEIQGNNRIIEFTVTQLSNLLSVDIRTINKMLRDAGTSPELFSKDPDKTIPFEIIKKIYAKYENHYIGQVLFQLQNENDDEDDVQEEEEKKISRIIGHITRMSGCHDCDVLCNQQKRITCKEKWL